LVKIIFYSVFLCEPPVGRIMLLAHPSLSVCPSVSYELVTRKQKNV